LNFNRYLLNPDSRKGGETSPTELKAKEATLETFKLQDSKLMKIPGQNSNLLNPHILKCPFIQRGNDGDYPYQMAICFKKFPIV
jgi:hypothetical protein